MLNQIITARRHKSMVEMVKFEYFNIEAIEITHYDYYKWSKTCRIFYNVKTFFFTLFDIKQVLDSGIWEQ